MTKKYYFSQNDPVNILINLYSNKKLYVVIYNNSSLKIYESIKDEISNREIDDLTKSVLVFVGINPEIRYRHDAKCMQLKIYNKFDDRGSINNLSDIQSVWGNTKE